VWCCISWAGLGSIVSKFNGVVPIFVTAQYSDDELSTAETAQCFKLRIKIAADDIARTNQHINFRKPWAELVGML
jgi:hypothetical protein